MDNTKNNLLEVENLKTYFPVRRGVLRRTIGHVRAVDGVSFNIEKGKTLSLVGESGCGKTTTARTIAALIEATDGSVTFDGCDVLNANAKQRKMLRRNIAVIFQDPFGSLNPRMTVSDVISEPMVVNRTMKKKQRGERVVDLLEKVGLSSSYLNRYPHEFSGGQRQRVGIARALALEPDLIICDEPVSALDVSIQSQILNLLKDLQGQLGLTYLFIAHDLAVVEYISDEVAVMYLGRIVERAEATDLYNRPSHPYTQMLMRAIPTISPDKRGQRQVIAGEIPSPSNPPSGCHFHPRCDRISEKCKECSPVLKDIGDGHWVACDV